MNIQENISLKPYNTFQIDCIAKYFVEISKITDLQELIQTKVFQDNKRFILWWGANILLTEEHFDGLTIKNNILGKEIIEEDEIFITIKVWGGENRDDFVWWIIDQGYCGIENLVSIPGSIGASPMQNIWAYGVEVWSCIESVSCRTLSPLIGTLQNNTKQIKPLKWWALLELKKNECIFWYRTSIFKQELKDKVFITHVTFKLKKYTSKTYNPNIEYKAIQEKLIERTPSPSEAVATKGILDVPSGRDLLTPKTIATIISEIRSSKLPNRRELGTAGSFFKNPIIPGSQFQELQKKFPSLKWRPSDVPSDKGVDSSEQRKDLSGGFVKLFAWQLIDLTWLKNLTRGNVGIYKKHALILVNHGWGTGQDIVKLAKHIQEQVFKKFWVQLSPEVNYI